MDTRRRTLDAPGFTFVEIMIVLAVLGILLTIAVPSYMHSVTKAKEATLKETLYVLREAIDQFYADNEQYPPSLDVLVENRYLRRIPKDPVTGSTDTWFFVPATDDTGAEMGVFDVHSGSDLLALDGTSYQDW
ncbi:MAG: type II secretion system protein [Candidatus Methylomirabilales bacterium]